MRAPRWTEYHLTADGTWERGSSDVQAERVPGRVVCIARVDFYTRAVELRAATPSAQAYLDKLLAAHPFTAEACRRWAVYVREAGEPRPIGLVDARNRFEAAVHGRGQWPPQQLVIVSEEEDPGRFQALLEATD